MKLNLTQTRLFLDALSGRVMTNRRLHRDLLETLTESERYVLDVMDRHYDRPVKHAAFLVRVMQAEAGLNSL